MFKQFLIFLLTLSLFSSEIIGRGRGGGHGGGGGGRGFAGGGRGFGGGGRGFGGGGRAFSGGARSFGGAGRSFAGSSVSGRSFAGRSISAPRSYGTSFRPGPGLSSSSRAIPATMPRTGHTPTTSITGRNISPRATSLGRSTTQQIGRTPSSSRLKPSTGASRLKPTTGKPGTTRPGTGKPDAKAPTGKGGIGNLGKAAGLAGAAGVGAALGRATAHATKGPGAAISSKQLSNAANKAGLKQPNAANRSALAKNPTGKSVKNTANKAKSNPKVHDKMNKALNNRNFNRFANRFNNWFNNFGWFNGFGFGFFSFPFFWDWLWFSPFYLFPWWFSRTFYDDIIIDYEPYYWDYDPYASQINTTYIQQDDYTGAINEINAKIDDLYAKLEGTELSQDDKLEINKLGWLLLDIKRKIEMSELDETQKGQLINLIENGINNVKNLIPEGQAQENNVQLNGNNQVID